MSLTMVGELVRRCFTVIEFPRNMFKVLICKMSYLEYCLTDHYRYLSPKGLHSYKFTFYIYNMFPIRSHEILIAFS